MPGQYVGNMINDDNSKVKVQGYKYVFCDYCNMIYDVFPLNPSVFLQPPTRIP